MRAFLALAAVLALSASRTAFAQEATQDLRGTILSAPRSRADVIAELERARANGELEDSGDLYGFVRRSQIAAARSRAEVMARIEPARRSAPKHGHSLDLQAFQ